MGLKCEKAVMVEKRILANADANFLSEEVFDNGKELYKDIVSKTFPLPYLVWDNDVQGDKRFDS